MPLVKVAQLVNHARRHGYLVASFTAHTAETMQAVVTAAEANRAPVIIAVETPSVTFLHHEINLTVARSIAERASVPVAIEVVCRSGRAAVEAPRKGVSSVSLRLRKDELVSDSAENLAQEIWVTSANDREPASVMQSAAFIGVSVVEASSKSAAARAVRKLCQELSERVDHPLVIDGDMEWSSQALCRLAALGAAKINYDRRLPCVIAAAASSPAKGREDAYWHGVERSYAALIAEITRCLKAVNSTGRAADVLAFAANTGRCAADHSLPLISENFPTSSSTSSSNSVTPFAATQRRLAHSI